MNDDGVTPVVGTVLLVAIMIATVGALMAWGLPAIQEMERRNQYQSIRSAFAVLDGVVDEVLPETGSSRTATIPTSDGGLFLEPTLEPYAVAWSYPAGNVTFDGIDDGDDTLNYTTSLSVDSCRFRHFDRDGAFVSAETRSASSGSCNATRSLDVTHGVTLRDGAGDELAEIWVFHPGRIEFVSGSAAGPFTVDYHNGAVAATLGQTPLLVDDPLILPLRPQGLTVGVIDLNGTSRSASGDRSSVHVALERSTVHGDASPARVDLYPLGDTGDAWRRHLTGPGRYNFTEPDGTDLVRYAPSDEFPLTLTHYVVRTSLRGVAS